VPPRLRFPRQRRRGLRQRHDHRARRRHAARRALRGGAQDNHRSLI